MKKCNAVIGIISFLVILSAACSSANKESSDILNIFSGEPIIPGAAKKIYINPILNRTDNTVLPDELIQPLKNRINFEGRLLVAGSIEQSDLEVNLEIFSLTVKPYTFDTSGNPIEKQMRTIVFVSIFNSKNNKALLKYKEVEAIVVFSEIKPPVMDEYNAIVALANILSERITSVITTGWYKDGILPSVTK
jgi:hypothetical protein